jgi:hypothetical protein
MFIAFWFLGEPGFFDRLRHHSNKRKKKNQEKKKKKA